MKSFAAQQAQQAQQAQYMEFWSTAAQLVEQQDLRFCWASKAEDLCSAEVESLADTAAACRRVPSLATGSEPAARTDGSSQEGALTCCCCCCCC